jgi:hypothetical protein
MSDLRNGSFGADRAMKPIAKSDLSQVHSKHRRKPSEPGITGPKPESKMLKRIRASGITIERVCGGGYCLVIRGQSIQWFSGRRAAIKLAAVILGAA